MDIRKWLNRAPNIDREIGRLLRERHMAYERCISITARTDATRVSGTRDPHKFDKLAEYEDLLDQKTDELYDTKCEILSAIMKVDDPIFREVLERRYIAHEKFRQISREMHFCYGYLIQEIHPKALVEVEKHIT